jgi:hypothetical protein
MKNESERKKVENIYVHGIVFRVSYFVWHRFIKILEILWMWVGGQEVGGG